MLVLFLAACQGNAATSDASSSADNGAAVAATTSPTATGDGQARADAREALYAPWERVLTGYVDEEGLVDYAGLAAGGRGDLEAFMGVIASTDPSGFGEAEKIAFWINAYNATTIYQVVQR